MRHLQQKQIGGVFDPESMKRFVMFREFTAVWWAAGWRTEDEASGTYSCCWKSRVCFFNVSFAAPEAERENEERRDVSENTPAGFLLNLDLCACLKKKKALTWILVNLFTWALSSVRVERLQVSAESKHLLLFLWLYPHSVRLLRPPEKHSQNSTEQTVPALLLSPGSAFYLLLIV